MNADFFQDLGTNIFKPVGDFVSGAVTALQPGRVQQMRLAEEEHKMNIARMQELLRNSQGQRRLGAIRRLMQQALLEKYKQTNDPKYLDPSLGIRFGTVPFAASDLNEQDLVAYKKTLRDKALSQAEGKPLSVNDTEKYGERMDALIKDVKHWRPGGYDYRQGELDKQWESFKKLHDFDNPNLKPNQKTQLQNIWNSKIDKLGNEVKDRRKQQVVRELRRTVSPQEYFGGPTQPQIGNQQFFTPSTMQQTPAATEEGTDIKDLLIGQPTAPKTFGQIGITDADDMSILQEMQKALPDRDLKQEYEDDPENMKRLMKLWQEGKLNKSNLHKAFSMIQQDARQALGIA